jgi:hypothetical protein
MASKILTRLRMTGDGYFEFETLNPDNSRLEVTSESIDEKLR